MTTSENLCVTGLHVSYGGQPVLRGLSFEAACGQLTGVIGPSGGGKTTLLRAILGLISGQRGEVTIGGKRPGSRGAEISYVPQQAQVDWEYPITVRELVKLGVYPRAGWLHRLNSDNKRRIEMALNDVDLLALADRPVSQLSGGQRQRATIARAIASNASTVLLDEPFAAVDIATSALIWKVLARFREEGKRIMVVHHELNDIACADQLVMVSNVGMAVGAPSQVLGSALFDRAFGASYQTLTGHSLASEQDTNHDRLAIARAAA